MLCIGLLQVQSALAVIIVNGTTTLFSDDFENDTLFALPTISPPDIGIGYSDQMPSVDSVVVQDPSATLEARAGKYWDLINDGVGISDVIAQFDSQDSGTVTAEFGANVIGADGGSLRMVFMQGSNTLTTSNPFGVHTGYLWTGSAWNHYGIPLPAGIGANDVFMAYYNGAHTVMKAVGGTEADGAVIDGAGKWHTIEMTQAPVVGSYPQFSLNGVLLEPVPVQNDVGAIDGLMFGANGPHGSQGYVDSPIAPPPEPIEPINIGSRRELFVDNYMVDTMSGTAAYDLKKPQAQDVALVTDAPWEGNVSAYFTIFEDNSLYRMYYRGWHYEDGSFTHTPTTSYAESTDGINWTKPNLGIIEYDGSTENNIVWKGEGASHNFTPFKDANPDAAPDAKYKALGHNAITANPDGLYAFKSPDGIHWELMSEQPVITEGDFDSQNLAFWDAEAGVYREYHRQKKDGIRDIKTGTSTDFLNWSNPDWLDYTPGTPTEHLYTNAVLPYERAPHLLLGFPTRYNPDTEQVEPILMSSRDGETFARWDEALIPITAPEDRDQNRSNYMAWGLVELPHSDRELSVYATEAYYSGPDSRIRRFTYRTDGFVSVKADGGVGELLTKPLVFEGDWLEVNFATFDQGYLLAELQDADGNPIPGFTLADAQPVSGDEIEQMLSWSGGWDVSELAGSPVRLRFELHNADLYSFRFVPEPSSLPGDADRNGVVNAADAAILASNWLSTSATWAMGDFNADNVVNDMDATLLAANWGSSANAAVPEPAWLTLVLGAIPILYLFRRR